jgi:putative ABC transport system ATP-binding protein
MGLLRELNAEGQTIVMVTHDLRLADQAGRIVRLRSGELDVASPERATA